MNIPKGLARRDIEEVIEKLLKDDKVNVIIIKEERKYLTVNCSFIKGGVAIELDDKGYPARIMGCADYNEQTGECRNKADVQFCKFIKWKNIKSYK